MYGKPARFGVWWVSTGHQRIPNDVEASQLVEQREGERLPLSAFHRQPDDAVVVWAGQSCVVPLVDSQVGSQVVVYGVFHLHVYDGEGFSQP